MKKFFLITNVSGLTYWSYLGTKYNTSGSLRSMVEKHGDVYVNAKGGWMPKDCAVTIHKTVEQDNFPKN